MLFPICFCAIKQDSAFAPSPLTDDRAACAGKTTLLRNLLSQNKFKIGCVVNDVAAVNIDVKLIRNQTGGQKAGTSTTKDLAPTIELQNGCACAHVLSPLDRSPSQ
jgi:Ni2+-binding GTPase involved in maturation of urease and hydrogenase